MDSCYENRCCCDRTIHLLVTIAAGIAVTTLIVANLQKLKRLLPLSTKEGPI